MELVDLKRLQELTDELYKDTGTSSSFAFIDGGILIVSGRQRICTHFHRKNQVSRNECIESNINLIKKFNPGILSL